MRRRLQILSFLALFPLATPLFGALSYSFRADTSGVTESAIEGRAAIDGPLVRYDIVRGDKLILKTGTLVLSRDGGHHLMVFDPAKKTFFEISDTDLAGALASLTRQLGGLLDISVLSPRVSVRPLGFGPSIEGFATTRSAVDASATVAVRMAATKLMLKLSMTTESWSTDRLPSIAAGGPMPGATTGIEALDRLIAERAAATKGFPLIQRTTLRIEQSGHTTTSVTTTTVSTIRVAPIPAQLFAVPAGYRKVPNPIEGMLGKTSS